MKTKDLSELSARQVRLAVAGLLLGSLLSAAAVTTTNVSVLDFSFSPADVTINVGDSVRWTWAGSGVYLHNSTGPGSPALWASPSTGTVGTTFSFTFASSGSYPYECTFHALIGMKGNVTVQGVTPAPITLSSAKRPSSSSFQFSYSATPGLSYVIDRAATLGAFSSISTNVATNSTMTFTDSRATNRLNFYRVGVLAN